MVVPLVRFAAFATYIAVVFFLPFSLLAGVKGLILSLFSWLFFLLLLGIRAPTRIIRRLGARELTRSEAPYTFHALEELCRRTGIAVPSLSVFPSKVPNIAVFGFSKNRGYLVMTSEVLTLSRTEQISLMARALVPLTHWYIFNATWLAQFLALIEYIVRQKALGGFVLQAILYPTAIIPIKLLGFAQDPSESDRRSVFISRLPLALSEVYRKMELALHTQSFTLPLSVSHLFLAEPKHQGILTGILFQRRSLIEQIRLLSPLRLEISSS